MAPKHDDELLQAGVAKLVSLAGTNITSATLWVKGKGGKPVSILATVGEVAPSASDWAAAIEWEYGFGALNIELADMFPGIVGANRLWGLCESNNILVISHA